LTPPATVVDAGGSLRIFLIADVRGYTTFTQERGDEAGAALATRFASIARTTLEGGGATGLEFRGDEVMAAFTSARQAIRTAAALQAAFVEATIADPAFPLPVGMGLDAGEAVEVQGGYRGGALNLAARLCSLAGPGEILASEGVVHLARRVDGIAQVERGSAQLKGLTEPVRVIQLVRAGWDPQEDVAYQAAIGPVPTTQFVGVQDVCPYRGLASFQPEDGGRFFGRDALVASLVEQLDRGRVLFVVGPSGSGKSSVVRAGLIPALQAGAIPGSERWSVALFSPRSSPSAELSYQLRRATEDGDAPGALPGPGGADVGADEARRLTDSICGRSGGLLLVIDQFEELFTLSPRGEQEAFVELLAAIVDPAASRVRTVLAMRADFYGICATFPWLARRITANQVLVGPMSRSDLKQAIEQPAVGAGLRLEDGLVDQVLEDAGGETAALPLVSHALAETWRRREGRVLTLGGYRDAGGVAGSISHTADALYESVFDDAEREACRRLMLRLVTPGEGSADSRRRLPIGELESDHDPAVSRRVAAEMIDARLLTADRDTLEIAHEALLRSWPRLRGWIEAGRDDLRTRQRIGSAAAEWGREERSPDLLYRGTTLQVALEWMAVHGDVLGPAEEDFLAASREAWLEAKAQSDAAARRSRRVRTVAVSLLAVLSVAAVGASIVAFSALGEAQSRFGQALATQARGLAHSDPRASIALSLEAMARGQAGSVDARAALVDGSQALADAKFVPSGPPVSVGDALTVAVSPDGRVVVTGNRDGSISTWGPAGERLAHGVQGHTKAIEEMDFTPDGRRLVSGSDDGTVLLWDLADPADVPRPTLLGTTEQIVWSVAVSPDGETVATASEDGTIQLWDLAARRRAGPPLADLDPDALTVAFSPDGTLLLAGNGAGEVVGWSTTSWNVAIPKFHAHKSDVWEIEFAPDGSRIATASCDKSIRVWSTATGKLVAEPFARSAADVRGVLLDAEGDVLAGDQEGRLLAAPADGSSEPLSSAPSDAQVIDAARGGDTLATLGSDQRLQLWSTGGTPTAIAVGGHAQGAYGLAATADGSRIATGDGAGNVRIYSAATGKRELGPLPLHAGKVWALAFSDDGATLASAGADGVVTVVDAATGTRLRSLPRVPAGVSALLFADGRLLVAGADGQVGVWKDETLERRLGPHAGATALAVSDDGVLAVGELGGRVRLWSLRDGRLVGELLAAKGNAVWGLAWSRDGATLAVATADEVVQLWDASSLESTASLTPHPGGALGVTFLSDGMTIVSTDRGDGAVRLWDLERGVSIGGPLTGHTGAVWRVVALPGLRFATSGEDGTLRIWDVLDEARACERARGPSGFRPQAPYVGVGEEPHACRG
jgi:WD40 repeat protein/class 3 adenylate cyclase